MDLFDFSEKKRRARTLMTRKNYSYMMLSRRDNFAWFTSGGDNKVFRSSETGMGILLIGLNEIFFIAQSMDAARIFDDELQGLDIELITLKWYEQSPIEKAIQIIGEDRVAADFFINKENVTYLLDEIYRLHYPLTNSEIEKYIEYGRLCDQMLFEIACEIRPGMTEHEIEAKILHDYAVNNMPVKVLLVSSDERIDKYRHPLASAKKVEKRVFLHPAGEKQGLHFNITRSVYFGDVPKQLADKQEVLNLCEAQAMSMCQPGTRLLEILEARKLLLKGYGFEDEWQYHYPGALSGYQIGSAQPFIENREIINGMPFDLFITVTGAKVEEMCLSAEDGGINLTAKGKWPVKKYSGNKTAYDLPMIFAR